jgi:plastocyanin
MAAWPPVVRRVDTRTIRALSLVLLTLTAGLLAGDVTVGQVPAASGSITGRIHVVTRSSRRLASAGAYPSRTVGNVAAHDASEVSNVVVFVKAPATPSAPTRANIRQVDEAFVPHLLAITAGSTVDFPNDDFIFHNVFSLSRAGSFDLGRYPQGQARSRTFTRPGLVKVFCHLHAHMSAIIRVFEHPYFAIPGADGQFTIGDVPAGSYDVVAWHERVGEVTLRATVGSGRVAPLLFSLPLTDTP